MLALPSARPKHFTFRTAVLIPRNQDIARSHLRSNTVAHPVAMKQQNSSVAAAASHGDLNNVSAMRSTREMLIDHDYAHRSLAIHPDKDDSNVRCKYRPFLLDAATTESDWISRLELSTVTKMVEEDLKTTGERIKVLVLTGSLRKRWDSRY